MFLVFRLWPAKRVCKNISLRSLIKLSTLTHTEGSSQPPKKFSFPLAEAQLAKINYKFHVSKAFTVHFLFVVSINTFESLKVKTQWASFEAPQSVEFLFFSKKNPMRLSQSYLNKKKQKMKITKNYYNFPFVVFAVFVCVMLFSQIPNISTHSRNRLCQRSLSCSCTHRVRGTLTNKKQFHMKWNATD